MKLKVSYIKDDKEVAYLAYNYDVETDKPDVVIKIPNKYCDDPTAEDNEIKVLIDIYKTTSDSKMKEAVKYRFYLLVGKDIEEFLK